MEPTPGAAIYVSVLNLYPVASESTEWKKPALCSFFKEILTKIFRVRAFAAFYTSIRLYVVVAVVAGNSYTFYLWLLMLHFVCMSNI